MSKITHEVPDGVFIVTLGEYGEGKDPYAVFSNYDSAKVCAEAVAARYRLTAQEPDEMGFVYQWSDTEETLIVQIRLFDVLTNWEVSGGEEDEVNK